jgi:hypothetical protein
VLGITALGSRARLGMRALRGERHCAGKPARRAVDPTPDPWNVSAILVTTMALSARAV